MESPLERKLVWTEKQLEQLRTENAALKEQIEVSSEMFRNCAGRIDTLNVKAVAMKETIEQQAAELEAAKYNYIGAMADCKHYVAMIEQQAEAIRLKDVLLSEIAKQIPEKPDYWSSCGQCERNAGDAEDALAIQPSPEILQARDERIAEACASVIDTHLNRSTYSTSLAEAIDQLRSGEWRKYL